jgi:flagellar motor switch protein FliN/FliY
MSQAPDLRGPVASSPAPRGEAEALERYAQHVFEGASKVLESLCGRPVRLTPDRIISGPFSIVPTRLQGPWIAMPMRATKGLSGLHALIWSEAVATHLAQCMLGETADQGSRPSPECLDALLEAAQQIAGTTGTSLRAGAGTPTAFAAEDVFAAKDVGELLTVFRPEVPAEIFSVARMTVEGGAASEVLLVATSSLLEGVGKILVPSPVSARKEGDVSTEHASVAPPFVPLAQGERAGSSNGIEMLLDVTLQVSVELGRTRLPIRDILQFGPGSVVELDKQAGEAVDILVNDKPIAKGEVIIIDENFGVRLTSITGLAERIRSLR